MSRRNTTPTPTRGAVKSAIMLSSIPSGYPGYTWPQDAFIIPVSRMSTLALIILVLTNLAMAAWVYLFLGRGLFWRTDQRLTVGPGLDGDPSGLPSVAVLVPARNEADILPHTLPQLLLQDYRGRFHVWLVDDSSADGTAEAALQAAQELGMEERLSVVTADPLTPGWTGKLWALHQGVQAASPEQPEYLLFVDADIALAPGVLRAMVEKSVSEDLHLVSVMALLKILTGWEKVLVPAFVYFFMLLCPFRWVNNPRNSVAAAAGGCLMVRRETLESAGGLRAIAGELIDDCSLAKLIKNRLRESGKSGGGAASGKIWLGLSREVISVRPYGGLKGVWATVSRTAFTQLDHSSILLAATVLGMLLGFWSSSVGVICGVFLLAFGGDGVAGLWLAATGVVGVALMGACYLPTLRWYRASPMLALLLPVIAGAYMLMTIHSAWQFWRGGGGVWKGRTYRRRPEAEV